MIYMYLHMIYIYIYRICTFDIYIYVNICIYIYIYISTLCICENSQLVFIYPATCSARSSERLAGAHHSLAGREEEGDDDSVGALKGDVNMREIQPIFSIKNETYMCL